MTTRKPYPSDLSDARWALIEPVLTAWRAQRREHSIPGGRRSKYPLRELLNAILYVDRTGIPWRFLPHEFPPWETTYHYFAAWRDEGIFEQLGGLLRRLARKEAGRDQEPSAAVIDAQSVKTSSNVPAAGQGADNAKKIVGRKRNVITDTTGLLLLVLVTAASVQDSVAGQRLIDTLAARFPTIRKIWADGGYRHYLVEHAARLGIDLEIVQRTPGTRGFTPLPRRWVVERSLGWFMIFRRLTRDYETLPASSTAMIHLAAIDLMTRRLTGETTPTWRDPAPSNQTPSPG
ncbi:IS5 family transposase [Streptomyces sp. TRM66268-LWL]|uniref:IS5 family transposase n=1 Tax=Streptomyces polyasparticus TaxID=2767826 RepID=A0ABR7SZL1_9ACTN|nr:IS5 family transposase [Streptomyces polyasparticus]MBC9719708.1 IS5 family transposase [Streptomyces polyasparticus]